MWCSLITAARMHEKNRQEEAKTSEPHKDERNDSKEGDNEGKTYKLFSIWYFTKVKSESE